MGTQTLKEAKDANLGTFTRATGGLNSRPVYYDGKIYDSVADFKRKKLCANAIYHIKNGDFDGLPIFYVDSAKNLERKVFSESVLIAKKLLGEMEAIQFKVSQLAVNACEIRHGGISNGIFTLGMFADQIGMNPKTLRNWVQVYNNVAVKLPKLPDTKKEWAAASRTNNRLNEGTRLKNIENNSPKNKQNTRSKRNVPASIVKGIFDEELEGKSTTTMFHQFIASAKYMNHKFKTEDFRSVDIKAKKELAKLIDDLNDLIYDDYTKSLK